MRQASLLEGCKHTTPSHVLAVTYLVEGRQVHVVDVMHQFVSDGLHIWFGRAVLAPLDVKRRVGFHVPTEQ